MGGSAVTPEARKILVVAPSTSLASQLHRWLCEAGYELTVVTTFAAAKAHLRTSIDLVVTQVRLAEYNGLQLALYAQASSIPTIVIGDPDPLIEIHDASGLILLTPTGMAADFEIPVAFEEGTDCAAPNPVDS